MGAVCALGDEELLRHPTPEMTHALGELCAHLVMMAAAAPYTGVDVHARGAVGALGDEGAAGAPSAGVDVHARELFTRLEMQGLLRYPIPELPYTPDKDVDAVHA
jgi:hypothetical protein